MPREPSESVKARVASVLGWSPRVWRPVHGGYTPAARYVGAVGTERCFLKVATNAVTRGMLRREARAYSVIGGDFVPAFFGWDDDPEEPLLLIEDLSEAVWPPPWTAALIEQVSDRIADMHAQSVDLPARTHGFDRWATVAVEPGPFLSLGLATAAWLERALPDLVAAEAACPLEGEALTHFDLRSDNICITRAGPKFIDWAEARRGSPTADLGAWLPSLELEGGPPPEALLPGHPEVAAWISGYFAANAGLPIIPDAPRVRAIQLAQLTTALPWAQRALGLPPLN